MSEPLPAFGIVLLSVTFLADRATVKVEVVMIDEVLRCPTVDTAAGTSDRLGSDPGERAGSVIGRPCQELGVGDSSTGDIVDAFPVERVPVLVPALVKGMSTSSLFAVTAAVMSRKVSESDHSFQIL